MYWLLYIHSLPTYPQAAESNSSGGGDLALVGTTQEVSMVMSLITKKVGEARAYQRQIRYDVLSRTMNVEERVSNHGVDNMRKLKKMDVKLDDMEVRHQKVEESVLEPMRRQKQTEEMLEAALGVLSKREEAMVGLVGQQQRTQERGVAGSIECFSQEGRGHNGADGSAGSRRKKRCCWQHWVP